MGGMRTPEFAFDAGIVEKTQGRLREDYSLPAWVQRITPLVTEFALGPPMSGANMHFHGAALSALVHGRKRWGLLPPASAYFSTKPGREWFDSHDATKPFVRHCVQRAGDLIFIPRNWGHAVINLQTSVSVVN